jgi:transketolase
LTGSPVTVDLARRIRAHCLRMTAKARTSHIGSCLSIADILAVLYGAVLKVDPSNPAGPDRDRFVLSKGHAAAALYAALAERGFFPKEWLKNFTEDGSPLAGHVVHLGVPGVEVSTGSLGHGLSIGCGMALAARTKRAGRVFVLLSDGELNEGAIWEAIMFAGHHCLANLTAIVDANSIQSFGRVEDVLDMNPLSDKWSSFGWRAWEIDGHDHDGLTDALIRPSDGRPTALIARTIKGKGVSFMENQLLWHYRSASDAQLSKALTELGEMP